MINTFPYYPKEYGKKDSSSSESYAKTGSGWSDMLGISANPLGGYSPAQQSLNIWGSNTSEYEQPGWERILGSFDQKPPTATTTQAPAAPIAPVPTSGPRTPDPAGATFALQDVLNETGGSYTGGAESWANLMSQWQSLPMSQREPYYGNTFRGSPGAIYNPNMDAEVMRLLPFGG